MHICKNGKCHRYVRSIRTCWSGILLVGSCSLRCCCITGETAILTMFPKPFHAFFSLALTGGLPPDRPRLRSTNAHSKYLRSLIAMVLTFFCLESLCLMTLVFEPGRKHMKYWDGSAQLEEMCVENWLANVRLAMFFDC